VESTNRCNKRKATIHLIKILELLHILRNNPEPAEGLIAEALDPAFVVAVIAPVEHEQYIVAGMNIRRCRIRLLIQIKYIKTI